jgi:hypothetical protein
MANRIRIGIDPGKNGYIAICQESESLNLSKYSFYAIPLIGKELDINTLNQIFHDISKLSATYGIYAVIEEVHAIYGSAAAATFDFGFTCGILEGLLVSKGIGYSKVSPKTWQKEMWKGVPLQQKSSSSGKKQVTNTKAMSLLAAKRMFPNFDLRDTDRCRVPHDGKVDALLLLEYAKRNF